MPDFIIPRRHPPVNRNSPPDIHSVIIDIVINSRCHSEPPQAERNPLFAGSEVTLASFENANSLPSTISSPTKMKFALRRDLLTWYDQNRRDLPWRKTRDPYRVWISEIMLQQTRVAAVLPRDEEFLHRFPNVQKLAAAREASVLAQWSGLGYYRRARNLHAAAKIIARENTFPPTAEALRSLPGVGRYTAAAIASIAFNEPVAVVDGNVERVLVRVLGKSKNDVIPSRKAARNLLPAGSAHPLAQRKRTQPDLWTEAQSLLDPQRPGDFNQAMMELGATVCLPRQPQCQACPIKKICRTRGAGDSNPVRLRQQKKEITYSLTRRPDSILLTRRSADAALMPGMWELPEVTAPNVSDEKLFSVRHSITVTNFTVQVVARNRAQGKWIRISRLNTLPLTGLAKKILRTAKIIQ
jgi:A/G-specific adenine glycosylase